MYSHGTRTNSLGVESGVPRANYRDRSNEDQQISWITNDNIKIMGKLKKPRKSETKFSEISQEDFVPQ
jgi:hypothetical protein